VADERDVVDRDRPGGDELVNGAAMRCPFSRTGSPVL